MCLFCMELSHGALYNLAANYDKAVPPAIPTKVELVFNIAEFSDVNDLKNVRFILE